MREQDPARAIRLERSADGRGGVVGRRPSRHAWLLVAMLWNALLPQVAGKAPPYFVLVGAIAAAVFGYFFVRSVLSKTRFDFRDRRFTCAFGVMPPRKRFEHPIADILRFGVDRAGDGDEWTFHLLTRGGARLEVPLDIDAFVVVLRGASKSTFGRARPEHVTFLVEQLNEGLEIARRDVGAYRVAGVLLEEPEAILDAEEGKQERRL